MANPAAQLPAATVQVPARTPAPEEKGEDLELTGVLGTPQTLSELEQAELFACEEVINNGGQTYVQVGLALARIRDGRLYRIEYFTFEEYCRVKWQYMRAYVYQLIFAAQLFNSLSAIADIRQPQHESQVRPLAGVPPDQARQAWVKSVRTLWSAPEQQTGGTGPLHLWRRER